MNARQAATLLKPEVAAFFDKETWTFSYVVKDPTSSACAVIDSVMDLNYPSGTISFKGADAIIAYVKEHKLDVQWLIETHVHADHLSAAPYIQEKVGGKLAIGDKITVVQEVFGKIFNAGTEFARDGSQFDHLFRDGERYTIGNLQCQALHTPGHTPACMTHVIGDAAFVGDTLFMPDVGTARADFPGGSASRLYRSITEILSLPDATRIFTGHDYQPGGRAPRWESTVAEQKAANTHMSKCGTEAEFVALREARDRTLPMPKLILHALQVNINGGRLPEPEDNGRRYLKFPLDAFTDAAWD